MGNRIGLECKAYRSATPLSSTAFDGATWVEMTNVRDVQLPLNKTRADFSKRGSKVRLNRGALQEWPVNFQIIWDSTDAACQALLTSYLTNAPIALAFLDGDESVADSEGPAANWEVMEFGRNEPLEEGVMVDVVVEPRDFADWYVTAGA